MAQLNIKQIAISDLILDPRNPRIAPLTDSLAGAPEKDWILMALGRHSSDDEERSTSTSYSSLKESIRASNGVHQPIIVAEAEAGRFTVIEGNTRVAIYLELEHEGATGDWSAIPAIVHPSGDESGEHAIRLQAHLVGPRPWRPYAKAKYLHELYQEKKLGISQILAICGGGGKRREIEEYIHAFTDMQDFYVPLLDGGPVDQSRFSAFVELQKAPILTALTKHGYSKTDFAKWVGTGDLDGKFRPTHTIRQLPRILANPAAKQRFITRDAGEALRLLEQPASSEVIRDASIEQLASALAVKIRHLGLPDIRSLREDPDGKTSQAVADCLLELQSLNELINPNSNE